MTVHNLHDAPVQPDQRPDRFTPEDLKNNSAASRLPYAAQPTRSLLSRFLPLAGLSITAAVMGSLVVADYMDDKNKALKQQLERAKAMCTKDTLAPK